MSAGALGAAHFVPGVGGSWPTREACVLDLLGGVLLLAAYQYAGGLDHPTRRRIYEHLLSLPGDHFRSIVRSLRLGLGTARHHLDVLARRGLVHEETRNGRRRFYPNGAGAEPQRNRLFEKHWEYRDLRLRVLFAVQRLGDARPVTVGAALGISRQLAAYHLSRLHEAGYLRKAGNRYAAVSPDAGAFEGVE